MMKYKRSVVYVVVVFLVMKKCCNKEGTCMRASLFDANFQRRPSSNYNTATHVN